MQNLYGFNDLIENFLENKISVKEFERQYLDKFLEDDDNLSEEVFQILDWFFVKVDAYTELPLESGDNPAEYITEEQLKIYAAQVLQKLRRIK